MFVFLKPFRKEALNSMNRLETLLKESPTKFDFKRTVNHFKKRNRILIYMKRGPQSKRMLAICEPTVSGYGEGLIEVWSIDDYCGLHLNSFGNLPPEKAYNIIAEKGRIHNKSTR